MRYIRFLKPPRIDGQTVKALITVTSDLGETFLLEDAILAATLRSFDDDGDIFLRKTLKWTGGMRSLPININISNTDLDWPARLHVGLKGTPASDHFQKYHNSADIPQIISAWSDILDPDRGLEEAQRVVERRFTPLNDRRLSIWEETGESIARHLWDAGVALSAYLDHVVALQAEALPYLEEVLSSAAYRKLNVLELGCGTGIVGISLAQTVPDCEVTLTDLPDAEEIVQRNIEGMNAAMSSSCTFQSLDWDMPLPPNVRNKTFDLIAIADCTYNPDSSPALVQTLRALIKRSPKAVVLLAMKVRHPDEAIFFELMRKAGFVIGSSTDLPLSVEEYADETKKVDVYMFHDSKRPALLARNSSDDSWPPTVRFWNDHD